MLPPSNWFWNSLERVDVDARGPGCGTEAVERKHAASKAIFLRISGL